MSESTNAMKSSEVRLSLFRMKSFIAFVEFYICFVYFENIDLFSGMPEKIRLSAGINPAWILFCFCLILSICFVSISTDLYFFAAKFQTGAYFLYFGTQ